MTIDGIQLLASDHLKFLKVLKGILLLNNAYFKPPERKHKVNSQSDKSGKNESNAWFDSFQFLIGMGHRHDDILNMSYGAFMQYIKAANKARMQQMKTQVNLMRAAHHADKKGFDKLTHDLKIDE